MPGGMEDIYNNQPLVNNMNGEPPKPKSPIEIFAEHPWLNEPQGPIESISGFMGVAIPTTKQMESLFERILTHITKPETVALVNEREKKRPEQSFYFEEQRGFIDFLIRNGFSELNLAICLEQANIGCLEDPHHHDVRGILRSPEWK